MRTVVTGGGHGGGGAETLKRKREGEPEALIGAPGGGEGESEAKRARALDGGMVGMSGKGRGVAGFSPEASVTPLGLGSKWDESPAGARPRSSTYSAEPSPGLAGLMGGGSSSGTTRRVVQRVKEYVKTNLLAQFCRKAGYRVLDVGCGAGADLVKWSKLQVREWVGVDVDGAALAEAGARYNAMVTRTFAMRLLEADATRVPVWARVGPVATGGAGFDIASCQFALSAGFASEAQARMMLWNLAAWLKPGAFVVGTTVDERELRSRLGPDGATAGGDAYSVRMAEPVADGAPFDYGTAFTLTVDGVRGEPEYVVPLDKLAALAAEFDLELVVRDNFIKSYRSYKKSGKFNHMMDNLAATKADWEVAALFLVFALRKSNGAHVLDVPVDATYPLIDVDAATLKLEYEPAAPSVPAPADAPAAPAAPAV